MPALYVIAGPNGAGKTTFARQFLPAAGIREFLNADSIAAGLSPLDPPAGRLRAARLLLTRWKELVECGDDFAFESTISGRTYAAMLREAKARGYSIRLCYLALDSVQLSVRRVRERVRKGGHDVPLPDLKRRFLPSVRNFFQLYLPLADETLLYDAALQPPALLVEWHQGHARVLEAKSYEKIHAKAN
ncbi:MAG: hypothetical protein PHC88_08550 [Terrimicrobiaceae bacterium]|nr:hypothetical protein [Terrimicrobiaceae bacterium]